MHERHELQREGPAPWGATACVPIARRIHCAPCSYRRAFYERHCRSCAGVLTTALVSPSALPQVLPVPTNSSLLLGRVAYLGMWGTNVTLTTAERMGKTLLAHCRRLDRALPLCRAHALISPHVL